MRRTILPLEKEGDVKIEESSYECEDEEEVDYSGTQNNGAIFACTNSYCTAQFLRYDRLERHLMSGQCKIKVPVMTMEDTVKTMYLSALGIGFSEKIETNEEIKDMVAHLTGYPNAKVPDLLKLDTPLAPLSTPRSNLFKRGFSLPKAKEKTRFKDSVVAFVQKIFEEGMNKKKKATAHEVMLRMRKEKIGKKLRFQSHEWLTEQQIRSLFCRFAAKAKKGEPLSVRAIEDVTIEEEEEQANLNAAREIASTTEKIIDHIDDDIPDIKDHPITVGEISICDLAKAINISTTNMKKVKPNEIQKIIEKIGADDLREKSFRGKEKKTNLEILAARIIEYVKENCCCLI